MYTPYIRLVYILVVRPPYDELRAGRQSGSMSSEDHSRVGRQSMLRLRRLVISSTVVVDIVGMLAGLENIAAVLVAPAVL